MNRLLELEDELSRVEEMSEDEVCSLYNTDSKEEILNLIKQDIEMMKEKELLMLYEDLDYELQKERDELCRSQGISRFC